MKKKCHKLKSNISKFIEILFGFSKYYVLMKRRQTYEWKILKLGTKVKRAEQRCSFCFQANFLFGYENSFFRNNLHWRKQFIKYSATNNCLLCLYSTMCIIVRLNDCLFILLLLLLVWKKKQQNNPKKCAWTEHSFCFTLVISPLFLFNFTHHWKRSWIRIISHEIQTWIEHPLLLDFPPQDLLIHLKFVFICWSWTWRRSVTFTSAPISMF